MFLIVSGITSTSLVGLLEASFGGFLYFAFLHRRRLAEGVTSSRDTGGPWGRVEGDARETCFMLANMANDFLGVGFKYFLCSFLFGEMVQLY